MRKKGIGVVLKKVSSRFDGSSPSRASPAVIHKVVRVEPIGLDDLMGEMFGVKRPRRVRWVLQATKGRKIEFEVAYRTRKEATSIARRLGYGKVERWGTASPV
jgi:hypothetical protein